MTTHAKVKALMLSAVFTALTAVSSQLSIPLPYVPINLALFSVLLSGALLGWKRGAASAAAYILIGAAGLPVFAGFGAGVSALAGATGGYIVGYLPAAALAGLGAGRGESGYFRLCLFMALGTLSCYGLGTAWFLRVTGTDLSYALAVCVLPFIPGDALKIALAALLAKRLRRFAAI